MADDKIGIPRPHGQPLQSLPEPTAWDNVPPNRAPHPGDSGVLQPSPAYPGSGMPGEPIERQRYR